MGRLLANEYGGVPAVVATAAMGVATSIIRQVVGGALTDDVLLGLG